MMEIGKENGRTIYEILLSYGPLTSKQIWRHLEHETKKFNKELALEASRRGYLNYEIPGYLAREGKETISIRTIERHLKRDKRIEKKGRTYFIPHEKRFFLKYRDPFWYGITLVDEVTKLPQRYYTNKKDYTRKEYRYLISELIRIFGSIVVYTFVESTRPVEDTTLSIRDREDLVSYWATNAIPLQRMFQYFQSMLDERKRDHDRNKTPISEMSEARINNILFAMHQIYPKLYNALSRAREKIQNKTSKDDYPV